MTDRLSSPIIFVIASLSIIAHIDGQADAQKVPAQPHQQPLLTEEELGSGVQAAWRSMCSLVGIAEPTSASLCTVVLNDDETVFTLTAHINWDRDGGPGQPFGALRMLRAYPCPITASFDRSLWRPVIRDKVKDYRDAVIVAKYGTAQVEANFFVVARASVARVDPAEKEFTGSAVVMPMSVHSDLREAEAAAARLLAFLETETMKLWMDGRGRLPPNLPVVPAKGFVDAWKDVPSVPSPPPEFCWEPPAVPAPPPPAGQAPGG
jgi:hypothetical protein